MRLKQSNVGAHTYMLALLVVLSAVTFTVAPALALPPGREYELVSPPYKGGYGASGIEGVSQDGECAAFYSPGVFNGNPAGTSDSFDSVAYMSCRSDEGWSTVPLTPPDVLVPRVNGRTDSTPDLRSVMVPGCAGPNYLSGLKECARVEFLMHDTSEPDVSSNWRMVGEPIETVSHEPVEISIEGASADFCHIVFESEDGAVVPEAVGVERPLYDLSAGCGEEPTGVRLVGVDNRGRIIDPSCSVLLGSRYELGEANLFHAVADGGQELIFTTCGDSQSTDNRQVFARLKGLRTIEISRPLSQSPSECGEGGEEIPCRSAGGRANAVFIGASEDGSRVFFTAPLAAGQPPLVPGDTDASNNLYLAKIGCPAGNEGCNISEKVVTAMTRTSAPVDPSEPAEVQGVVKVAPDGSRVYFVARGVLTNEPGPEGRVPLKGADNLYVYAVNPSTPGRISFIGDLCSGHEMSGSIEDALCPSENGVDITLWHNAFGGEAQTAGPDGRFLVFSSYAQLIRDDTDRSRDVFEYDSETGRLVRISAGENAYDANGNSDTANAKLLQTGVQPGSVRAEFEMTERAVSEDGATVVFSTAEPLSPQAVNGLPNVYEWHDGRVSSLSGGASETSVEDVVMSPSGDDLYFVTTQSLVPADSDQASDVYDAHRCSASAPCFPPAMTGRRSCEGDACQGPLTNPAPLLVPGSVSQAPGGNFEVPKVPAEPKAKPKAQSKKRAKERRRPGKRRGRTTLVHRRSK